MWLVIFFGLMDFWSYLTFGESSNFEGNLWGGLFWDLGSWDRPADEIFRPPALLLTRMIAPLPAAIDLRLSRAGLSLCRFLLPIMENSACEATCKTGSLSITPNLSEKSSSWQNATASKHKAGSNYLEEKALEGSSSQQVAYYLHEGHCSTPASLTCEGQNIWRSGASKQELAVHGSDKTWWQVQGHWF